MVSATDISGKYVVPISGTINIMTVAYETASAGSTISIIKNGVTATPPTTAAVFTNPGTTGTTTFITGSGGTTTTPIQISTLTNAGGNPISVSAGDTIQVRSNGNHFDRTCVMLYFG